MASVRDTLCAVQEAESEHLIFFHIFCTLLHTVYHLPNEIM